MTRGKNAGIGLIALLGLIAYILSPIIQFIIENWLVILVVLIIGLAIYLSINYQSNKNEEIEIERNKLKKMEDKVSNDLRNFRIEISNKYREVIEYIQRSKGYRFTKFDELNINYPDINLNPKSERNQEFQINKLKNILKEKHKHEFDFWNFFYDSTDFTLVNPKINFDKKMSTIPDLIKPNLNQINSEYKIPDNVSFEIKLMAEEIDKERIEVIKKIDNYFAGSLKDVSIEKEKIEKIYLEKESNWKKKKDEFYKSKSERNSQIDLLKTNYLKNDKKSIEKFSIEILKNIKYNHKFHLNINSEYNPENKVIIIEYLLPAVDLYPKIKELKFLKTRNEYKEINLTVREQEKLYEDSIYSIILNSIYQVLKNDSINAINSIVFNGWTDSIDRTIGKKVRSCVTSIHCTKDEFLKINLSEVEPKACFKSLKGISAHNINHSTSIKPIINIEQNDKRFVESKSIEYNSSTNLASMNWEDFEHLIREIFECEFSSNGGKVKVTQASRDGGVDAIAYDPDPIRGGKIIIQAKRYTNIVGVSAVRDLYGTVLNEGASKGILVTTSDFGSDSFEFSKNKPITLINGGNLLLLLEKHGFKARININEAKEEQKKIKP